MSYVNSVPMSFSGYGIDIQLNQNSTELNTLNGLQSQFDIQLPNEHLDSATIIQTENSNVVGGQIQIETPKKSIFSSFNFMSSSMFEKCVRAPWQPPNIVFPIVWTYLYILYFIILVKTWDLPSSRGSLIIGLALNILWIFAFRYNSKFGLLVIALMIAVAFDTSRRLELDGKHTLNNWFQTYIGWLIFAFTLNFYITMNCNN